MTARLLRRLAGIFGDVLDQDAPATDQALTELVLELQPALRILLRVGLKEHRVDAGLTRQNAGGQKGRPVRLSYGDLRQVPPRLDAARTPGGGRRSHVDGPVVIQEPNLGRLPETAALSTTGNVDVLAVGQIRLDRRGEIGSRRATGQQH